MERPKSRLDRYPSVHSSVPGSIRSEPPPSYSYQNRRVLAEKPSRANTTIGAIPTFHPHKYKTAQRSDQEEVPPQPSLPPRNESIVPELTEPGKLAVRHDSRTTSPGHKRISQIQEEEINQDIESKRSSVVSTLSDGTPSKRKSHIGPWHLGKTIGKGGCSSVREVRHRRSTFKAAAKIIAKSAAENIREQSVANLHRIRKYEKATIAMAKSMPYGLEREIVIMKLLNHPHIVQLYDVWENRNELYLIMEHVDGYELFSYIEERGGLGEFDAVWLFRQIVGALVYCHRLKIYHRDLKPENILMSRDTGTIKLVDFGMAALQPEGGFLSTACGSPHYAAPEVVFWKRYDGGKADVWSCGVILYVMLCGTPPFHLDPEDESLELFFKAVAQGDYKLPNTLSEEAQDLISHILIPSPDHRIDMESVWNHPLLHKYDHMLPEEEIKDLEDCLHPEVQLEHWNVWKTDDIDPEILRNMRTLWHSEKESTLIDRLLNDELNQEKYFYQALENHRDDALDTFHDDEAFIGLVGYSPSDKHHLVSRQDKNAKAQRSQSQYSILNDEHLYSKQNLAEHFGSSVSSYDPYRASKDQVLSYGHGERLSVTVHRRASKESSRSRNSNMSRKLGSDRAPRQGSSLRVHSVKRSSVHGSQASRLSRTSRDSTSRPSMSIHSSPPRCYYTYRSQSHSRSATSSRSNGGTPAIVRPRDSSYKRGVSFKHLPRPRSQQSTLGSIPFSERTYGSGARQLSLSSRPTSSHLSPPSVPPRRTVTVPNPNDAVVSRKENRRHREAGDLHGLNGNRLKVRSPKAPSHYIDSEARKVSTELEKACEEAFFRSSIGSTVRTDSTNAAAYQTPPSSVSRRSGKSRHQESSTRKTPLSERPLPPVPSETPNTFLARELQETRARLAKRYTTEGEKNNQQINEIISRLDSLIAPADSRRHVSAPEGRSPEANWLPTLPEEGVGYTSKQGSAGRQLRSTTSRAVTDPHTRTLRSTYQQQQGRHQSRPAPLQRDTIRIVDPDSPCPANIAPLNIRKKASFTASTASRSEASHQHHEEVPSFLSDFDPSARNSWRNSGNSSARLRTLPKDDEAAAQLATLDSLEKGELKKAAKKRSGWFKRKSSETKEKGEGGSAELRPKQSIPNISFLRAPPAAPHEQQQQRKPALLRKKSSRLSEATASNRSDSSEFPIRNHLGAPTTHKDYQKDKESKKRLWDFFRGRSATKKNLASGLQLGGPADFSTESLIASYELPDGLSNPPAIEPTHKNWLARFLRIKPASRVLCFQVGRGRVRSEIVRLLRDWRRYGIRDVAYSRERNVISGRVDKNNYLRIKPVSFSVELFAVLEHGRRAQLSLARFMQTRGAASSFRKVVQVIQEVLNARGIMVEDEQRRKGMLEILG